MSNSFSKWMKAVGGAIALGVAAAMLVALADLARPDRRLSPQESSALVEQDGQGTPASRLKADEAWSWWQVQARWQASAHDGVFATFAAWALEDRECDGPKLETRTRRGLQIHRSAQEQGDSASFCLRASGVPSRVEPGQGTWVSLRDDREVSVEWDADALRVPTPEANYLLRLVALTGCADDDSMCSGSVLLELVPESSQESLSMPSGGFTSGRFDVLRLSTR